MKGWIDQEGVFGVIEQDSTGGIQCDAVIKAGAGIVGKVLPVRVGTKDQTPAEHAETLARKGKKPIRVFPLGRGKTQGLAGEIPHQGLSKAWDDLREYLVLRVRDRMDRVNDEGVLGVHDFLDEHRHEKAFVGDTHGLTAQVCPLVPFGGPHLPDTCPDGLPLRRPGKARVFHDICQGIGQIPWRLQL